MSQDPGTLGAKKWIAEALTHPKMSQSEDYPPLPLALSPAQHHECHQHPAPDRTGGR